MGYHKQLQRKSILAAYLKGYLGLRGFICVALAAFASMCSSWKTPWKSTGCSGGLLNSF